MSPHMLTQLRVPAMEYERSAMGGKTLDSFFHNSIPRIRHPEVTKWAENLLAERQAFWNCLE